MTPLAQPLPESPWGSLLTVYFVLIAVPSGLTVVNGWRRLRRPAEASGPGAWAASVTALGLLAVAGLLLVVDLGRPERFFLMVTRFGNLDSPISLGAKALALKGLLLVVDLYLLHRLRGGPPGDARSRATVTTVTVLLVLTSAFLAVYPVVVLERTWLAPLAGTSGALLVFGLTGLLTGAAAQMLLDLLVDPPSGPAVDDLRAATLATLGIAVVAGVLVLPSVLADPSTAGPVAAAGGGAALLWWGGSVTVGTVLPAAGLVLTRHRRAWRWPERVRERWQWGIVTGLLLGAVVTRYLVVAVGPGGPA